MVFGPGIFLRYFLSRFSVFLVEMVFGRENRYTVPVGTGFSHPVFNPNRRWLPCGSEKGRREGRARVAGEPAVAGFDPARMADDHWIQSDGRERPAPERAELSPGGGGVSRPRPRLRPGRGVRAARELGLGPFSVWAERGAEPA
jgi:hypothetical protein